MITTAEEVILLENTKQLLSFLTSLFRKSLYCVIKSRALTRSLNANRYINIDFVLKQRFTSWDIEPLTHHCFDSCKSPHISLSWYCPHKLSLLFPFLFVNPWFLSSLLSLILVPQPEMRAEVARKRQDREELRKLVFNKRVAPAIGLYVPVVSHVCFLHHGSHKTSDYTYASLLKATQENFLSPCSSLSSRCIL